MDKRKIVPTMKERRPGFDLKQKERDIVAGARHLGGRFTWNGNNREELLCRKRALRTAWLSMGKFWTVKGHWAKKRITFGCKVLGAAVLAAETYHAPGNQFARFREFLELIRRFEFEFCRREIFFLTIRIFGAFKVQTHTVAYMCMCCGLFVPTQFHFECCGFPDD